MIVPVMAISNLVLTQQIYSEETNSAHAHYREPVPLRTMTTFTTTTSVDWEKTGTRTSVSAGKRKLKMQSVGKSTTTTLNVNTNVKLRCLFATNDELSLITGLSLRDNLPRNASFWQVGLLDVALFRIS